MSPFLSQRLIGPTFRASYHAHTVACISISHRQVHDKTKFCWLDLSGTGLSALERLCLEEALLRHDPQKRNWAIMGTHDPIYNTRMKKIQKPVYDNCVVIMGLGGKPQQLLNIDKIKEDGVVVIKRFSGGGTVVVDQSCLWTTFIGRPHLLNHVAPFPRDIMEWSAKYIFDTVFKSMNHHVSTHNHIVQGATTLCVQKELPTNLVLDMKSCGLAGGSVSTIGRTPAERGTKHTVPHNTTRTFDSFVDNATAPPSFALRENDYVLGDRKMGGNAQSISREGWLHHTSFLWDFVDEHMEYLSMPSKRPDYRKDRKHTDFLIKLRDYYSIGGSNEQEAKKRFFKHVQASCAMHYELEEVKLKQVLDILDSELGGMQNWFETKSRTKIVQLE
jgi:lipoate-protein ligase A